MDELPLDVIFDIFSRIPVKSLLRFRSVSKQWCNIIDHPCLARMHITRGVEEPTPILVSDPRYGRRYTLSLYSVKEKSRYLKTSENSIATLDLKGYFRLGFCNGLFYFAIYSDDQEFVILSNPLRKEFQRLPEAKINSQSCTRRKTYGLGFDVSTNTYKMVCVFEHENGLENPGYRVHAMVHTLGTSSWKNISKVPQYPICGTPVFVQGALHWITYPLFLYDNFEGMIVSFDIKDEEFGLTSCPYIRSEDSMLCSLFDLNGNLAIADHSCNRKIEILVLKDYDKKKEWVREYRIEINAPDGRFHNGHITIIGIWKDDEILMSSPQGYFIYNPKTGLRYTHSSGLKPDSTIYSHKRSLISLSHVMNV